MTATLPYSALLKLASIYNKKLSGCGKVKHWHRCELKSVLVQLTLRKLCDVRVVINYTSLSMAYYTYDSTATCNFLSFGPTAFTYISKEWHCNKEELQYVVLEILNLNQ